MDKIRIINIAQLLKLIYGEIAVCVIYPITDTRRNRFLKVQKLRDLVLINGK